MIPKYDIYEKPTYTLASTPTPTYYVNDYLDERGVCSPTYVVMRSGRITYLGTDYDAATRLMKSEGGCLSYRLDGQLPAEVYRAKNLEDYEGAVAEEVLVFSGARG